MKFSRLLAAVAVCVAVIVPVAGASAAHPGATTTRVSLRAEGVNGTLVPATAVLTRSAPIDPDGKPADTCTGNTAAVALQRATHGRWTAGPYSASLGYPVVAIRGEAHPFTSSYYWALWINDKPATTGICQATLHRGDRVLFFAQCSKQSATQCPLGLFNPPVLALTAPRRARSSRAVTVTVRALDNASGKATVAAGVTIKFAGRSALTDAHGRAKLSFPRRGRYVVAATAPNAVRDETTIVIGSGGA